VVNQACVGAVFHIATARALELAPVRHQLFSAGWAAFALLDSFQQTSMIFFFHNETLLHLQNAHKL